MLELSQVRRRMAGDAGSLAARSGEERHKEDLGGFCQLMATPWRDGLCPALLERMPPRTLTPS